MFFEAVYIDCDDENIASFIEGIGVTRVIRSHPEKGLTESDTTTLFDS